SCVSHALGVTLPRPPYPVLLSVLNSSVGTVELNASVRSHPTSEAHCGAPNSGSVSYPSRRRRASATKSSGGHLSSKSSGLKSTTAPTVTPRFTALDELRGRTVGVGAHHHAP